MNIQDAAKRAKRVGLGITRESYGQRPMMLLPTNSTSCVLMIPFKDNQFKTKRWNPSLDDLTAADWYVCR